jgi:predicted alpha/beta-fold hydrolase
LPILIIPSTFHAPFYLRNRHVQTILPTILRTGNNISYESQRLELPDGDFVDVFWCRPQTSLTDNQPIVIVLHGMGGHFTSNYVPDTIRALLKRGYRVAFLHSRGCSGEPNRLPVTFHAADTSELNHLVHTIKTLFPAAPVAALGFSLGGSVLLKWLGEPPGKNLLCAAVAVGVPFDLSTTADTINRGFAQIYQLYLLHSLKSLAIAKLAVHPAPLTAPQIKALKSLRQYDHEMTAKINGFAGVDEYYARGSCKQYLINIKTPTLIVNAIDDPFVPPACIPGEHELSANVTLELSQHGGHVGFLGPARSRYFAERGAQFFDDYLD